MRSGFGHIRCSVDLGVIAILWWKRPDRNARDCAPGSPTVAVVNSFLVCYPSRVVSRPLAKPHHSHANRERCLRVSPPVRVEAENASMDNFTARWGGTMKMVFKKVSLLFVISLMLIGCGGGGSSGGSGGGGNGGVSTAGDAQGVYSGTASSGYSFYSIVLPDDKFYGVYGTISGGEFLLSGMITGQGTSGSSTYTASVTDFLSAGLINSGSITASYVAGSSFSGTLDENGTITTFTGTSLSASLFDYDTPASLSAITGALTGNLLLGGETATVTINSNGSVSGSNLGCSFSGTVAADSSNKNFFDVSLTFGASPCSLPNQTASGIGVEFLLSDGVTHQLLGAVSTGTSAGTVFAAER